MKILTSIILWAYFLVSVAGASTCVVVRRSTACDQVQTPTEDGASVSSHNVANVDATKYRATKFTYTGTTGKQICKIDLWLHFVGTNSHNYYVAIWGDDGLPDEGDILGTSDVRDLSGIGGSESQESFVFSTFTDGLVNSTTYYILLYSTTLDGNDYVVWHAEENGAVEGMYYDDDGAGTWEPESFTKTHKFKLYSQ